MDLIFLAQSPSTSPVILAALSKDEDVDVRRLVAWNPNTLPESLATLSQDRYGIVRSEVAENPNTPYGIWISRYGRMIP